MKLNKFQKVFLFFLVILFLFTPLLVLAVEFKPGIGIPAPEGAIKAGEAMTLGTDPGETIFKYFSAIYSWAVPAIGVIAVIMIMIAGFQWMLAGGSAVVVTAAKKRMTDAVMGLILIIGAYWMLNFINPALVEAPKLTLKTVETKELKFPDPAEVAKARNDRINKECEKTSDCRGTEEDPIYDLFCFAGKCNMLQNLPGGTHCAGYRALCKKDKYAPGDQEPLGCCDEREKCIKIAGGSSVTGWFVKDVKICLPSQ